MATATWALNTLNNSDATFRAWGSGISTALAAVGMVQTADTGQIDWGTVTLPGTGVYAGYEIWRFNDALQATHPLFFKIEYGTGTTATRDRYQITIGKGSDGSGVLTSAFTGATMTAMSQTNGSATTRNWYMSSGDGSMLVFNAAPDFDGFDWGFAIERSRSPEGVATGSGVLVLTYVSNSAGTYVFNYATAALSPVNSVSAFTPKHIASGGVASGGAAPVFPSIVTDGLGAFWQPRCVMHAMAADVPALTPISVPGYGAYLPLGGQVWGATSSQSALIRWS